MTGRKVVVPVIMALWAEPRLNRLRAIGRGVRCLLVLAAGVPGPAWGAGPLEDAERFVNLLEDTAWRPSATELDRRYLSPGSAGLRGFVTTRAGGPEGLRRALETLRGDYRRAVTHCLPAARQLADRLPQVQARVGALLRVEEAPPVRFLFGAGRSAGTVLAGEVLLALEVVCREWDGMAPVEALLEAYLVHELVHAHQLPLQSSAHRDSLLRQSLIEGFADYVTARLLGDPGPQERRRAAFAARREAALWADFARDMHGLSLERWMYGPGRPGEPADLGYWLGKRVSEAYVDTAPDSSRALRDLLVLADPERILEASGYAPPEP